MDVTLPLLRWECQPENRLSEGAEEREELQGLAARIRAAIDQWALARGMSRGYTAFARKAEIPQSSLMDYISPDHPKEPGALALLKIGRAAGVSVDYLLTGEEPQETAETSARALTSNIFAYLRRMANTMRLPKDYQRRWRDRVDYIQGAVTRQVFEAELFLRELESRAARRQFDAEEFRREWTEGEGQ